MYASSGVLEMKAEIDPFPRRATAGAGALQPALRKTPARLVVQPGIVM
jgi:hypothetical protein